jgi:hypothetical protein
MPPVTAYPSVGPLTSVREISASVPVGPQPQLSWDVFPNLRLEMKPLLTNELVLVSGPSGEAVAYTRLARDNNATAEVFRFRADGPFLAPPGQMGETAYFGSQDGNLYALDLVGGQVTWRHTAGTPVIHQPAVTDQDVYVTSQQNGMARLDRASGDALWRVPRGREVLTSNPDADRFLTANPKFVYAFDRSGRLLILDRKRGVRLSWYDVREFPFPVTNVVTDRLYLAAHDGLLLCLHDRGFPTPHRQRRTEESVSDVIKQKLAQAITDGGGRVMSVGDLLADFRKRYNLTFKVADQAFKQAGGESILTRQVTFPRVDNRPLSEVLQQMLSQANSAYQVVGDTILIVPTRAQ